jgi:hypothetical protein
LSLNLVETRSCKDSFLARLGGAFRIGNCFLLSGYKSSEWVSDKLFARLLPVDKTRPRVARGGRERPHGSLGRLKAEKVGSLPPHPNFAACFRARFHGVFVLFWASSPHRHGEVNKGYG